jgi:hypothetical protein
VAHEVFEFIAREFAGQSFSSDVLAKGGGELPISRVSSTNLMAVWRSAGSPRVLDSIRIRIRVRSAVAVLGSWGAIAPRNVQPAAGRLYLAPTSAVVTGISVC